MSNQGGNGRNVAVPDENRPSWRAQDEAARGRRMSEEDERYMQGDRERFGSQGDERGSRWDRDEGYRARERQDQTYGRRYEEDHTYGSRDWGYPSHMEERARERDLDEHSSQPRGTSRWGGYEGRYLGQAGQEMEWGDGRYVQGGFDERTYGRGGVQDRYGSQGHQGYRHPSHRGKGPAGYVRSDERIREMVCEALTEHDDIDATNIEVAVKGGDVVLSGTVEDRRQKRLAEDLVDQVTGVKDVQNQLRLAEKQQR